MAADRIKTDSYDGAQPFRLLEPRRPFAGWGPEIAGITTGAFCAWLLYPVAGLHELSWLQLWAVAARCTIPVFLASAFAAWIAGRSLAGRAAIERAITVGCAATWIPPVAIFFDTHSPWAVIICIPLAAVFARAVSFRRGTEFTSSSGLLPSVWIAALIQLGLVASSMDSFREASILLATASFLLTYLATMRAVWPRPAPGRRPRKFRIVPAFLLALSFSAGGLTPYLAHGEGSGDGGGKDPGGLIDALFATPSAGDDRRQSDRDTGARAVVIGESYPGVILWPDVEEKYVTLAPPPPSSGRSLFPARNVNSFSIPFYGAYWYFRGPGKPPKNSLVTHGDPAKLSFRSTDLRPLAMEAWQNFGGIIQTSCCSAIGVAIKNADRRPATVALELVISNTTVRNRPSESLGLQAVESRRSSADAPPEPITVLFRMPRPPRLEAFDEAMVRFHLLPPRSDRSARIAIRRFVFLRD